MTRQPTEPPAPACLVPSLCSRNDAEHAHALFRQISQVGRASRSLGALHLTFAYRADTGSVCYSASYAIVCPPFAYELNFPLDHLEDLFSYPGTAQAVRRYERLGGWGRRGARGGAEAGEGWKGHPRVWSEVPVQWERLGRPLRGVEVCRPWHLVRVSATTGG